MMKLILTSAQRTGSRWLRDLLADYISMSKQDEISFHSFDMEYDNIIKSLNKNRIVKIHDVLPSIMEKKLQEDNLNFVGIVRDIRDTAVSYAFHHRYHEWEDSIYKEFHSDNEAIKYTVMKDRIFKLESEFQIDLMKDTCQNSKYVWIVYRNLNKDPHSSLKYCIEGLGIKLDSLKLSRVINMNSFHRKSGRNQGVEKRMDMWRRKGIVGDWKHWFDEDMIKCTEKISKEFYRLVDNVVWQ